MKSMNDYSNNGYILQEGFFNADEINLWQTAVAYLQNIPEIIGGPMKYFEKSQIDSGIILNRVENFCDYLPLVDALIQGNKIKSLIKNLTGRDYILFKEKINFKLPGGGGFKPHQDGAAFRKFVDDELVTVMIPIHVSNEENGCFRLKKDAYTKELRQHNNGSISECEYSEEYEKDWQSVNMKPGDILCFSSYLIHQSNDNLSNLPRSCYFITYSPQELGDQRQEYFAFKREKFPPRIERDVNKDYGDWQRTLAREII